jgi:hypothetical protein
MFTETEHLDILHDDHIIAILFMEDGVVDDFSNSCTISLGEREECLGVAFWCLQEAFSLGIVSDAADHDFDGAHQGT